MDIMAFRDYVFYDFIEDQLGYSLKGSGRMVSVSRNENEVIVKVKRFRMSGCINHEFIFTNENCFWKKNYWHNDDLTDYWLNFVSQIENTY